MAKMNTVKTFDIKNFKHPIEYKMCEAQAKAILKMRKEGEKKMPQNEFLQQWVNREFGLRGYCTKVIINNE